MAFKKQTSIKTADYTELKNDISKVYGTLTDKMGDLKRLLESEIPEIVVKTLYVGDGGIRLDASATIEWAQVEGTENVATLDSVLAELQAYATTSSVSSRFADILNNSNLSTVLGQNYIITGYIAANQIAAGVITGCTLQTQSVGGKQVVLHEYNSSYYNNGEQGVYIGYANADAATTYPTIMMQKDGGSGLIMMTDNTLSISVSNGLKLPASTTIGGSAPLTQNSTVIARFG